MKVKVPIEMECNIHIYKTQFTPNLIAVDKLTGKADHHRMLIEIDPILPNSQRAQTLCHERIHIMDRQYSLGLSEDDIDRLAEGVAEFIVKNLGIELDWSLIEEK